ncbi:YwhD family protein [Paenibacillus yanchengensis]|uniref:YwhD family protein n=1 Tax=Paenibacillus yanchengensis TaxID=2035833 RepID=A0ABW4YPC8_9BACL
MTEEQKPGELKVKKNLSLNLIGGKRHRGFGAGAIDLSDIACIIIDNGEAYIDVGALHGKSKIEKGVRFSPDRSLTPDGRQCWVVWVAVERHEEGSFYAGATACEMWIDSQAMRGWKILADHVNKLDYAMKRRVILDELAEQEKEALKKLLMEHNPQWWERSTDELKEGLS